MEIFTYIYGLVFKNIEVDVSLGTQLIIGASMGFSGPTESSIRELLFNYNAPGGAKGRIAVQRGRPG